VPKHGPEAVWQKQVLSVAVLYGWDFFHPADVDPRRVGGTPYKPGWPDLVLAKPVVGRCLFVELKAPGNYPSADQRRWLHNLYAAGLEVGMWWPKDIGEVTRVLGPRQERLVLPVRYRSETSGE
jgi:hypothetical protein